MNDAAMYQIATTRVPSNTTRRMWAAMVGQTARTPTCPALPRQDGRLAVVTGATGGIGAEIARGLARRGAELVLPCRNPQRGSAIAEVLQREFGPSCVVHLVALELSDLGTVAPAVEAIVRVAAGRPIDLLVENGGVWPTAYARSAQGYEIAFAVNVLSHFALRRCLSAAGLLPRTRVVVMTGDIYVSESECSEDFVWRGALGGKRAYSRSKLGNVWIAFELARRQSELDVFVVHPGIVATNLGGDAGRIGNALKRRLMISPEQGAQMPLVCATQPGLRRGGYYHNTLGLVNLPANDPALDAQAARRLWERCEELTE